MSNVTRYSKEERKQAKIARQMFEAAGGIVRQNPFLRMTVAIQPHFKGSRMHSVGIAVSSPKDNFSFVIGADIAIERCYSAGFNIPLKDCSPSYWVESFFCTLM